MNILVTGGAGYIGSIISEELIKRGHTVVVLDNLQQGHREAVIPEAIFVKTDLADENYLSNVFRRYKIEATIHMAAETVIEYSMSDPKRYFINNIINGLRLLNTMLEFQVKKMVFSSTAAVYGEPTEIPIKETHPLKPINSYGESKLMFEKVLDWYYKAYGMYYVALRYFNAAGASASRGEDHRPETHLIPNVFKVALGLAEAVPLFGGDYGTKDGSCVRDYIHVIDLAQAHVLALESIERVGARSYNMGNGKGFSVKEIIKAAEQVTGKRIGIDQKPRRPGDPATLVADSSLIRKELGWTPALADVDKIIGSAWEWHRKHPAGYGG